MYIPEKPLPLDFYKEEEIDSGENIGEDDSSARQHMLIEFSPATVTNGNCKSAKKRAETWAQDETRCLVCLRREIDGLFNTSKSNKHLWDQISMKMREKGFDRSSAMCTDKWRNLLKEYKKARNHHAKGSRLSKMSCYKEIDDILKERTKIINCFNSSSSNNNDFKSPSGIGSPYMQFTDKGIDDAGLSFGSLEACGRPILNLESRLDHNGNPLAIATTDTVQTSGVPPWNWRDAPGVESPSCGRVITVKWDDYTRRIGIDANSDAIKEAIKAVFGLRTRRAFWLEDVDGIVRSIDRDMPLGHYNLQLDEGIAIKVCFYDESNHIPVHTEDKTFYTNDDLHAFLTHRGWTCIRELDEYASSTVDSLNELRAGTIYRGVN